MDNVLKIPCALEEIFEQKDLLPVEHHWWLGDDDEVLLLDSLMDFLWNHRAFLI